MIRPTNPRDSLIWEIERAMQRPSYSTDPQPSTRSLVVLAVALALLAGVVFRLIDRWGNW